MATSKKCIIKGLTVKVVGPTKTLYILNALESGGPDNCRGHSKSGSVGNLWAAIDILCHFVPNQGILIFAKIPIHLSIQNIKF